MPKVGVAANGGSDLVYVPVGDRALARKVVDLLAVAAQGVNVIISP